MADVPRAARVWPSDSDENPARRTVRRGAPPGQARVSTSYGGAFPRSRSGTGPAADADTRRRRARSTRARPRRERTAGGRGAGPRVSRATRARAAERHAEAARSPAPTRARWTRVPGVRAVVAARPPAEEAMRFPLWSPTRAGCGQRPGGARPSAVRTLERPDSSSQPDGQGRRGCADDVAASPASRPSTGPAEPSSSEERVSPGREEQGQGPLRPLKREAPQGPALVPKADRAAATG
jgi:hypothetical protein